MRFRSFARFAAATLLVLAGAPGPALAQGAPGEHERSCAQIAQRHRTARQPLDQRKNNFFLFDAAGRGCDELIRVFLAAGASVAARDRSGNTALSIAARMGRTATVELLVAAGSQLDHRNLAGASPLLRAATDGRRRTARALLALGADPNLGNTKGVTPLITAAYNGEARMLDLLLEAGATPPPSTPPARGRWSMPPGGATRR